MKKLLSLLLFLPIFLLSCSTNIDEITISNEEIDEITNNQVNENVSVASKKVSDFDNYIEAINEYISRFKKLEKYELISSGNAEALLFTQKIYATVAKDKDKYKIYNTSTSSLKNQYHEAIFEDKIKYRDKKEDEFIEIELSDYKKTYGITPYDNTLFDYIINEDTVNKIEREKIDDNYKFTIDLDINTDSVKYVKIQMKKLGNLDDYPEFIYVKLYITMDNDFKPIIGKIESKYKVKSFFTVTCTQELDVSFNME